MKYAAIILAFLLALVAPTFGSVYITNPVDNTKATGGSNLTVQWQDTSASPAASQWQGVNVWLAVGSQNVQYKLAQLGSNIKPSRGRTDSYTIPKNLGENSADYFIRMESTGVAANGTADYMAFSAKFAISGMTGTFNSTIKAAIAGTSGSSASTTAAAAAGAASSSTAASSSSKLSTSVVTSSSTASSAKTNSTGTAVSASSGSTSGASDLVAQKAVGSVVAFGVVAAAVVAIL